MFKPSPPLLHPSLPTLYAFFSPHLYSSFFITRLSLLLPSHSSACPSTPSLSLCESLSPPRFLSSAVMTARLVEQQQQQQTRNTQPLVVTLRGVARVCVCVHARVWLISQGAKVVPRVTEEVAMGTQAPPCICHCYGPSKSSMCLSVYLSYFQSATCKFIALSYTSFNSHFLTVLLRVFPQSVKAMLKLRHHYYYSWLKRNNICADRWLLDSF